MIKGTIAVDFDGVLHPYTAGWTGVIPEDEAPTEGAVAFLHALRSEGFSIVVLSSRASSAEGEKAIFTWLSDYHLWQYIDEITHEKPPALAYVDDRAVLYRGSWAETMAGVQDLVNGVKRSPAYLVTLGNVVDELNRTAANLDAANLADYQADLRRLLGAHCEHDFVTDLMDVASDHEWDVLQELRERAGHIWTCRNPDPTYPGTVCGCVNYPEDGNTCEDCGAIRPEQPVS